MNSTLITRCLVAAALVVLAPPLGALNLAINPGTFGAMPADGPPKAGVLEASFISAPTPDLPDLRFTARVTSEVYSGDPLNPLGGLTFWYQVDNVPDPVTEGRPLVALGIALDFPTAVIEVNQGPELRHSADLAGFSTGNSISFLWVADPIVVGSSSDWLTIYTDFNAYKESLVGVVDGTVEDVAALVPTRSESPGKVPDPASSLVLFTLGCAALAGCRRVRS